MDAINTYQDLLAVGEDEKRRMDFALSVMRDHQASPEFQTAVVAREYYRGVNTTITNVCKYIRDAFGRNVPDIWSPNHKIACHYYGYLVDQLALFLLGNGVSFSDEKTKERLGKNFDKVVVKILIEALNSGVCYGFANKDKIMWFSVREFAPLVDEETGLLRAGVRFWRLDSSKPLRLTLYEEDGYTEYIQRSGEELKVLREKRPYLQVVKTSEATGDLELSVEGRNYPSFPIVPLYNKEGQSELTGNREVHDALDLMLSGLINNVDSGEFIYWILKNSGGMEDQESMTRFIQMLKTTHVVAVDQEDDVQSHSPVVNFAASQAAIEELRRQIFDNHMGVDPKQVQAGAMTATQIRAAYEPLNSKADLLEMNVTEFIQGLLAVFGIEDDPTYTRSDNLNQLEAIQTIVAAGTVLPQEYMVRKILEILGDIDKTEEVLAMLSGENMDRFGGPGPENDPLTE